MNERAGRTSICSVVFTDITGYSKLPDMRQLAAKGRLNDIVSRAIDTTDESERIVLDTGDGVAISFFGDPEAAIFAANAINNAFGNDGDTAGLTLRTGINLGPVKIIVDVNRHPNVVGDGINVAQRVMSFAEEGEILVSRSYYEVVARLRDENDRLFSYLGIRKDKHVREHEVYAFGRRTAESRMPPQAAPQIVAAPEQANTAAPDTASLPPIPEAAPAAPPTPAPSPLSEADLKVAERHLSQRIGPLAGMLVKRAAKKATSLPDLYQRLAESIPERPHREAFLNLIDHDR